MSKAGVLCILGLIAGITLARPSDKFCIDDKSICQCNLEELLGMRDVYVDFLIKNGHTCSVAVDSILPNKPPTESVACPMTDSSRKELPNCHLSNPTGKILFHLRCEVSHYE